MRFDLHLRTTVREQIEQLADTMKAWEQQARFNQQEIAQVRQSLVFFDHTTARLGLRVAGVDGSGDFPALSYADSFIYFTVAQGTQYVSDAVSGLREEGPVADPLVHFSWLPEDPERSKTALDEAFAALVGMSLSEVIRDSDYRTLKAAESGRASPADLQIEHLIRPHASDAGNVGLQLRSVGELAVGLRQVARQNSPADYVLMDGTFSLPFVGNKFNSLFYEHLKRLCCVKARERDIGFFALSKSHGLPSIDLLEDLACQIAGLAKGETVEHWYLRLPVPGEDGWEFSLAHGRRLPPPGAVTYLVRFHRTTPVMRLDMDRKFWRDRVLGTTPGQTEHNERRIFEDLDYVCHDQRCYGYPYPIKAAHNRASLTQAERVALRKQIVDAAVRAGMKRTLFRDASIATGHA